MKIVADRDSVNAKDAAARNCNVAIRGASEVEAAPFTVTSPSILQGLVNTQFCPAETVGLPLKTPLYLPLQLCPEARATGTKKVPMALPSASASTTAAGV